MSTGEADDSAAALPGQQPQQMPSHGQQLQSQLRNTPQQGPPVPAGPSAGKARLQCHACNRLLEYDAGAQYVQCFSCSTMNAVQQNTQIGGRVLSMLCAICHTTNLAPYGINYVRCGSCSTISQVSHAYRQDRMMSPQHIGGQPTAHHHQQGQQQMTRHDRPMETISDQIEGSQPEVHGSGHPHNLQSDRGFSGDSEQSASATAGQGFNDPSLGGAP